MTNGVSTNKVNMTGGRVQKNLLPGFLIGVIMAFASPRAAYALSIIPRFNANVSVGAQAVIGDAIQFYQNMFSDPITVNIEFHNMPSGLGASLTLFYVQSYATYRTALFADATSVDDATANATIGAGPNDPVINQPNINIKTANGRAVGLNTPGGVINSLGFCTFIGDGCIGLNVALTTTGGGTLSLLAVVEHEVDEVLGLGSSLSASGTLGGRIFPEDLFRYASPGVRSFATNGSTTNPCGVGTPSAFFSINGTTSLNQFNNCNNGGDYGDWITHTQSQVQDAFTNGTGSPLLNASSSETRALDVIGYTRGQAAPVPEPVSLVLLGTGIVGVAAARRPGLRRNSN